MNTLEFSNKHNIKNIIQSLEEADCVLIGTGAGLSSAAGIDYGDTKTFAKLFPALVKKGFTRQYEMIGFYDWSEAEKWAYWATHVNYVRFEFPLSPLYQSLFEIVKNKDYYVITSNVDAMFHKAGFDEKRIFTPQGDYARLQCLKACANETWPAKPFIDKILPNIDPDTFKVKNPELIPYCPNCGGPVFLNLRMVGMPFVDEPYQDQQDEYINWLEKTLNKRLFMMEYGVGFNSPGVIRWPFERIVNAHPNATLLRVNKDYPEVPDNIKNKSICIRKDVKSVINTINSIAQEK